jgi:secreted trypsin-like serine protease
VEYGGRRKRRKQLNRIKVQTIYVLSQFPIFESLSNDFAIACPRRTANVHRAAFSHVCPRRDAQVLCHREE